MQYQSLFMNFDTALQSYICLVIKHYDTIIPNKK